VIERFTALVFSGVTDGAITALAAVGLLLLYKASGVINFAHGDLITLGAFLGAWLVTDDGWGYVPGSVVVLLLMFAVGVVMERVAVAPLRGRSVHVVVIATLGLGLALRSLIANWQGNDPKRIESPAQGGSTRIFGAAFNHHRLVVVIVAALVIVALTWFFARTRYGRQVRALAADRDMARLAGVRAGWLSMAAFGASAALAGLCGLLTAPLSSAQLDLGFSLMLNAFAAMILGGFGSIRGVAVAGLMIGLVERVIGGYVLTTYSSALPFVLMIVVIAYRPEGLFGAREHAARL
jgi:branched-chain amino acid transport system permease protein